MLGVPCEKKTEESVPLTGCTCRYLIYVGECRGGVNGTDEFFDALKKVRERGRREAIAGEWHRGNLRKGGHGAGGGGCPLFIVLHIVHTAYHDWPRAACR